jgi:hypothetical protein
MTKKESKNASVPIEKITSKIYLIRGHKVMLDRDLAELYKVETKQLKRAVRRNIDRFPDDFMFELTKAELENWRCQFGTSKGERKGLRYKPLAFTEQGVAMLLFFEASVQLRLTFKLCGLLLSCARCTSAMKI